MTHFARGAFIGLMMMVSVLFVPSVSAEADHWYYVQDRADDWTLHTIPPSDGLITGLNIERYICGLNTAGNPGDDCDQTTQGKLLFHYNVSHFQMGNKIKFKIENTGEPHHVHLDISLCWKTNIVNEMMCDEKISNLYNDETDYITMFGIRSKQYFIMIDAKEGTGGDQTSVKVSRQELGNSNNDRTEPELISAGAPIDAKVCHSECTDDVPDPVDVFAFEIFAGDYIEIEIWSRGCEIWNDEKVKVFWRHEYELSNYTMSEWFTLDDQGCGSDGGDISISGTLPISGMYYVYFIADDPIDKGKLSYTIHLKVHDTSNRNTTADRDGDGVPDVMESECGTDYTDSSETPPDYDSDGDCDILDGDDDNDGFDDSEDDCQFSPDEDDFDNDGCTDSEDEDDDNDGTLDIDDPFPHDSTQSSDEDEDGYGDNPSGTNPDQFPSDPTQWSDEDEDGYGDNPLGTNPDQFPSDPTQWSDEDEDGYGDNPDGNQGDQFPSDPTQWADSDGDGYGDNPLGTNPDRFPSDSTQWSDSDGDGRGDNPGGNQGDQFPSDPTQWADSDGDGYGDNPLGTNPDQFRWDFTQWSDSDGDGYGDNPTGTNPDGCHDQYGLSYYDRLGCPDEDGDGWSDLNDDCPYSSGTSTEDRTACPDTDGDGWSDPDEEATEHPEGNADAFQFDSTQWRNQDDDEYGDNPSGTNPDDCPTVAGLSFNDRHGCPDYDYDGWSDDFDWAPFDGSQHEDNDEDGFGDNSKGNNGDDCPNDWGNSTQEKRGCVDRDGDGWDDGSDVCNHDATNQCLWAVFTGQANPMKAQGGTIILLIMLGSIFVYIHYGKYMNRRR
jgi:hypothetical protein